MLTRSSETDSVSFVVAGRPATFATAGEKPWRMEIQGQAPSPSMDGRERGLILNFRLASLSPNRHPLDVDNLCEPVFSELINRLGWFGGRRTALRWWHATKRQEEPQGLDATALAEALPDMETAPALFDGVYSGVLPKSAKDPVLAGWLQNELVRLELSAPTSDLACFLGFASPLINIGDIATGAVKAVIDGLYPILGGAAGAPWDHRIQELTVAKGLESIGPGGLRIRVWNHADKSTATPIGSRESAAAGSRARQNGQEGRMASTMAEAIWEAFADLGGTRTVREIQDWVNRRFPGRWKDVGTTMADLVYKGNASSTYKERQQFLERVGHGQYRVRAGASHP